MLQIFCGSLFVRGDLRHVRNSECRDYRQRDELKAILGAKLFPNPSFPTQNKGQIRPSLLKAEIIRFWFSGCGRLRPVLASISVLRDNPVSFCRKARGCCFRRGRALVDQLKLCHVHTWRMAERFDVARKKKIERFNLVDIRFVFVELRKRPHLPRTANGDTSDAGACSNPNLLVDKPRCLRIMFSQACAIHLRSSASGSVGFNK
jgi:hypothetical protein